MSLSTQLNRLIFGKINLAGGAEDIQLERSGQFPPLLVYFCLFWPNLFTEFGSFSAGLDAVSPQKEEIASSFKKEFEGGVKKKPSMKAKKAKKASKMMAKAAEEAERNRKQEEEEAKVAVERHQAAALGECDFL